MRRACPSSTRSSPGRATRRLAPSSSANGVKERSPSGRVLERTPSAYSVRRHVRLHGPRIAVDHQPESLRQKRLEHQPQILPRRMRRRFGDHIESVHLQPTWTTHNFVGVDSVSRADQIHHGGRSQFIAATAESGSHIAYAWIQARGVCADANVGGVECGRDAGRLSDCRTGKQRASTTHVQVPGSCLDFLRGSYWMFYCVNPGVAYA